MSTISTMDTLEKDLLNNTTFVKRRSIDTGIGDFIVVSWGNGGIEQLQSNKTIIERHPCPDVPIFDLMPYKEELSHYDNGPNLLYVFMQMMSSVGPLATLLERTRTTKNRYLKRIIRECIGDAVTLIATSLWLQLKFLRQKRPSESLTTGRLVHLQDAVSVEALETEHKVCEIAIESSPAPETSSVVLPNEEIIVQHVDASNLELTLSVVEHSHDSEQQPSDSCSKVLDQDADTTQECTFVDMCCTDHEEQIATTLCVDDSSYNADSGQEQNSHNIVEHVLGNVALESLETNDACFRPTDQSTHQNIGLSHSRTEDRTLPLLPTVKELHKTHCIKQPHLVDGNQCCEENLKMTKNETGYSPVDCLTYEMVIQSIGEKILPSSESEISDSRNRVSPRSADHILCGEKYSTVCSEDTSSVDSELAVKESKGENQNRFQTTPGKLLTQVKSTDVKANAERVVLQRNHLVSMDVQNNGSEKLKPNSKIPLVSCVQSRCDMKHSVSAASLLCGSQKSPPSKLLGTNKQNTGQTQLTGTAACTDPNLVPNNQMLQELSNQPKSTYVDNLVRKMLPKGTCYKCVECGQIFSEVCMLQDHAATVHGSSVVTYKCLECEFTFITKSAVEAHYRDRHINRANKCDDCTAAFKTIQQLQRHVKRAHNIMKACPICGQQFTSQAKLQFHKANEHSVEKTLHTCDECKATFVNESARQAHYREQHPNSANKCNDHTAVLGTLNQLQRHVNVTRNIARICQICGQQFSSRAKLQFHKAREHPVDKKPYICGECGKEFVRKVDFVRHSNNHKRAVELKSKLKFECQECDAVFSGQASLQRHSLIHIEKITHKCPHCQVEFPFDSNLRRHVNKHHGGIIEKTHRCEWCPSLFAYKVELRKHTSSVHPGKKIHRCTNCTSQFLTRYELRKHAAKMHGQAPEKKLKCPYCPVTFPFKSALQKHARKHTGEKPFKCQECGTAFSQQSQMTIHFRTQHTNEKPHSCKDCGDAFQSAHRLNSHKILRHGVKKPFVCQICEVSFLLKYKLKIHLRVHTKERPYKCKECGKAFADRCNMLTHTRVKHTGERPYQCPVCGEAFASSADRLKHLRKHNS